MEINLENLDKHPIPRGAPSSESEDEMILLRVLMLPLSTP